MEWADVLKKVSRTARVIPPEFPGGRVRTIRAASPMPGPVIYWMSRDQRAEDNWALLFAQKVALELRQPFAVVFCLAPHK